MTTWRLPTIVALGALLMGPAAAQATPQDGATTATTEQGDVLRLRDDAPREYVVKKGDTLWDISAMFLNDPWLWPELWRVNDTVANPHLIYPGDRLYLSWVNGRPQLTRKAFKSLTPEGVIAAKGNPLPTFDYEVLKPFLDAHYVLSTAELADLPKVLGDNRGAPRVNGMTPVFIDGTLQADQKYRVFTPLERFDEQVVLLDVAGLRVSYQQQDMTEGELIQPKREISRGDVVMAPHPVELPDVIIPTNGAPVDGHVVATLNSRVKNGKYDIVILDKGRSQGVAVGQMFQAVRPGTTIFTDGEAPELANLYKPYDDLSRSWRDALKLPPRTSAELLVIQVFDGASAAIVVESYEWFEVGSYFVPKIISVEQ